MNSTAGLIGQQIKRDPEEVSTQQLLERGIIAEVKIVEPTETKRRSKKNAATD